MAESPTVARKSNFEVLRILAILMIIAHHLALYGEFGYSTGEISVNKLWIMLLTSGGKIGVDIFILISGYFLISSDRVKVSKVLRLWIQVLTYSVGAFLVFVVILGIIPVSLQCISQSFFPLLASDLWFVRIYLVIYLLHPFINRALLSFDQKTYKRYLCLLGFLWCIVPTITHASIGWSDLVWFIVLYSVAGYYKIFGSKFVGSAKHYIWLSLLMILLVCISALILDAVHLEATYFYHMSSLPVFLAALFLFVGFSKLKIQQRRWINRISSAVFGVYLIHDNALSRIFLWKNLFRFSEYADSFYLIPYTLDVIMCVFVGGTLIELLRQVLLERYYMRFVDKVSHDFSVFGRDVGQSTWYKKW